MPVSVDELDLPIRTRPDSSFVWDDNGFGVGGCG
jgi:hypothetical protein